MALTQVTGPYPIFTDLDGSPLDDGYLYIGAINDDPETNPIQAFWDSALTIPATQPIRTSNGYAWRNGTPGLIYTAGQFSITIRNKRNEFVLYSPVGYGFDPAAVSASVVKNDFIGDGVEVDFTLSASPSTKLATNVFINGVYQEKDSYTLTGNVITFSIAPPLNSSIEVMTNETGVINTGNATAITYTAGFPGATAQTVQTKLEQYLSVKDFGAVGDGVTDDTAAIQAALTAAGNIAPCIVYADQAQYLCDEVNVPSSVTFKCNLKIKTAATVGNARNMVRVNSGCSIVGALEGSNTTATEVIERGIYPAVDTVTDVYLDVEITKVTVGVAALNPSGNLTLPPRRWTGIIRCTDIAAYIGGSNGYGLNGTLCDSDIQLFTVNVPRHGLYLAAAACNNYIIQHDDGARFAPVDIAAFAGQPGCHNNKITAFVRNHAGDYPVVNCVGGFIAGNCRGNSIELRLSSSSPLYAAFRTQAQDATTYPKDNQIVVYNEGVTITGTGVVELNSGSNTTVSIYGYSNHTGSPSCVLYVGRNDAITPTSPQEYAAVVGGINYTCGTGFSYGVVVVTDYADTDLGKGVIKITGNTLDIVNFVTFGAAVKGWIYETNFSQVISSVASGAVGSSTVTFDNSLPQRKYISYSVTPTSDPVGNSPTTYIYPLLDGSCTIKVKNNDTSTTDFVVSGRAWGF